MTDEVRLVDILEMGAMSLTDFFKLALQLVERLKDGRHQQKQALYLHPDRIFVQSGTLEIIRLEQQESLHPWIYQSPVQTGKMNGEIDHRADYYILGLLFYRMLTGTYPFNAQGKSEWIHAHLAKMPIPADEQNPSIPKGLSKLLDKLLSKSAEERYQTIKGLELDLKYCMNQFERSGTIAPFLLARIERADAVKIPDGIYGRDKEISLFQDVFQWTTLGSTQMICVSGPSGIGKTALVLTAIQKIALGEAYLISGKFEPFHQDPMSPLIHAFQELVQQLLNEDKQRLEQWKESFMAALGSNGAVLLEVIPEMEKVIGKPNPVEKLPPGESIKRLQFVIRRFVQVFCQQKHPLIFFLDDLQWADAASWRLIQSILTDPQSQSLLLIVTIRHEEPFPAIHFSDEFERIEQSGVSVHYVPLDPLKKDDINRIIGDTLSIDDQVIGGFTQNLFEKSGGNPFLFRQWFQSSLNEHRIHYNDKLNKWIWINDSKDRLGDQSDADLLLRYMISSINRFPELTRQVLLEASCLGRDTRLSLLSELRRESPAQTLDTLQSVIQQQLIVFDDAGDPVIRFFHDRVQEAAYLLLDEQYRESVHWRAGKILLDQTDIIVHDQRLFDIANHLNKGSSLAETAKDKEDLVQINAQAGRKAKAATAYESALLYFQSASERIDEVYWKRDFVFCFELFADLLECKYICNQLASIDEMITELLARARNPLERTIIRQMTVTRLLQAGRYGEGIALGVNCLRDLGIRISDKPGKITIVTELLITRRQLGRKSGKLSALPSVSLQEIKVTMNLLTIIIAATFLFNREIFCVLICKFVRLSLRYGNSPFSATAYVNFGYFLCDSMLDIPLGKKTAVEGLQLAETLNLPSILCKIHLAFGAMFFLFPKKERDLTASLQKSMQYGMEAGDYLFFGHAAASRILNMYMLGRLDQAAEMLSECREMLVQTQNDYLLVFLDIFTQWSIRLQGPESPDNKGLEENDMIEKIQCSGLEQVIMFQYYCCRMQQSYIFGDLYEAYRIAKILEKYEQFAFHSLNQSEYYFYYGLVLTSLWTSLTSIEKRRNQGILNRCLRKLHRLAKLSPEHIHHKAVLLSAEQARIQGKHNLAALLYDHAILDARNNGYLQHEAIANECAGTYYFLQLRKTMAKGYLIEAYTNYREWGATNKAEAFRDKYDKLYDGTLFGITKADMTGSLEQSTVIEHNPGIPEVLDMSIIQEAYRSMAAESDQRKLIEKIVRAILENAGAQQGCFIVKRAKSLYVEISIDKAGRITRESTPVAQYHSICLSAVQYTINTNESILLEHAALTGRFIRDPYVTGSQAKSLMCLPIFLQNSLSGVLYLENNLMPGAFAAHQLDMLRMLTTQTMFLLKLFPYERGQENRDIQTDLDEGIIDGSNDKKAEASEAFSIDPLTNREMEVLQLMSIGLSNQEIAQKLTLTVGTVKLHINRIFSKMNVTRRKKAVFEAKRMNLLS